MTAMRDPIDPSLPEWVGNALREPVSSRASARTRIMDAVRGLPAPRRMAAPMRPSRWLRRGLLSPVGSVMTTAAMALVVLMRFASPDGGVANIVTATRVLGDSVVAVGAMATESRWLDTLRVVEFVIRGSSVRAAAVIGDFNQWRRGATPLLAAGRGVWRARVLVPREALQLAYLVNNEQVIHAEPLAARVTRVTSPAW